jgi:hypothetical protein
MDGIRTAHKAQAPGKIDASILTFWRRMPGKLLEAEAGTGAPQPREEERAFMSRFDGASGCGYLVTNRQDILQQQIR